MTGLLPDFLRHAVTSRGVLSASQSFGLVSLIVLVALLLEREVLRSVRSHRFGTLGLSVTSLALLIVVALTILARLAPLIR